MMAVLAVLGATAPSSPFNRTPAPPVSRSQVDGITRGHSPMLRTAVFDPDADLLDVTFYGRTVEAERVARPRTVIVVPDPQHYSRTAGLAATYRAQMGWIVSSRRELGTAFVVSVGDLVQRPTSTIQWAKAGEAWNILDEAGIPYSIVPGNHDMTPSGDAGSYERTFPTTRFEDEVWYGGWMGDPGDDIADPADRGNRNSYQTFSAGGVDFLVVNIEVDLPLDAVTWAQGVIDAHPRRQVILVTHRWMGPDGIRWRRSLYRHDVPLLSPEEVWQRLVAPNCSVVMVLAGHDPGEAARVDENRCGRPVVQMLADYQRRPRGGDGWLRSLTFDAARGVVDISTYSVTLDAFEMDADSRFSLPWAGSGTPFVSLGTATDVPSGGVAALRWSDLEEGSTFEWFAVASDGSTVTAGTSDRFSTP